MWITQVRRGALCGAALCTWPLAASAAGFTAGDPAASGYHVTLADDFRTLNTKVWETQWWYTTPTACETAFLPGTLRVSAAGLDMHVQSLENVPECAGMEAYSFAHLDSAGTFAQRLGYFEARIKSSGAAGTLIAFWLLPASGAWPPELDIEEIRGDVRNTAYLTNHFGAANNQHQFLYVAPASLGGAYHIYGALVTSTVITWYVDGVARGQTARAAGELSPLFPIFSLYTGTCGDGWAGCPDKAADWSADARVAWMRVWAAP